MKFTTCYKIATLGYKAPLLDIIPYILYSPESIISRLKLWGIRKSLKFAVQEGTWMFQAESELGNKIRVKDSIPSRHPNGELSQMTYASLLSDGVYEWQEVAQSLLRFDRCERKPYHHDPRIGLFN
jgi:hypothetical protein